MAEAAALQVVRRQELGSAFDGVLLVLAFLEAGRLTAADIHWGRIGPHLVRRSCSTAASWFPNRRCYWGACSSARVARFTVARRRAAGSVTN